MWAAKCWLRRVHNWTAEWELTGGGSEETGRGTARSKPKVSGSQRHRPGQRHQPDAQDNEKNGQTTNADRFHLAMDEYADEAVVTAGVRIRVE